MSNLNIKLVVQGRTPDVKPGHFLPGDRVTRCDPVPCI